MEKAELLHERFKIVFSTDGCCNPVMDRLVNSCMLKVILVKYVLKGVPVYVINQRRRPLTRSR